MIVLMVDTRAQLSKTNLAISRMPIDEAGREALRQKAGRYSNECGCSMGSLFLIAAIVGLLVDSVFLGGIIASPVWGTGLLFLAAITGKLVGMTAGRIRLSLLHRSLSKTESTSTHPETYRIGVERSWRNPAKSN